MFDNLTTQLEPFIFIISLIPMMYILIFSKKEKDERGQAILARSYQYAYSFVFLATLCLFISTHLSVGLSFEQFRLAIVYILLAGNALLGVIVFILNRRY